MNTVQEVLDECRIEGNKVYLPDVQLDRALYVQVDKKLKGIGGKWNRKEKAHVFSSDPSELMGRVQNGETINLKKEFQFFQTPETLAEELVEMAFELPCPVGAVLEPSAGKGRIVDAIHKHDPYIVVHCCELMGTNTKYLEETYGDKIQMISTPNFLDLDRPNFYSMIIANPPFTKGQDIEHVRHMYKCLEPGGVMVSVMSSSWLHNSTKKYSEFRKWIGFDNENEENWKERIMRKEMAKGHADVHYMRPTKNGLEEIYIKSYEAGTFKESGTNVITVVVRIRKA